MPEIEVYEREFEFMPCGELWDDIASLVVDEAPPNGNCLDLMCGSGFLLGKIKGRYNLL